MPLSPVGNPAENIPLQDPDLMIRSCVLRAKIGSSEMLVDLLNFAQQHLQEPSSRQPQSFSPSCSRYEYDKRFGMEKNFKVDGDMKRWLTDKGAKHGQKRKRAIVAHKFEGIR